MEKVDGARSLDQPHRNCAYVKGFALTGNGGYDYAAGLFNITAKVSGDKSGSLTYSHNYSDDSISVTGEYGGETIDLQR